MVGHDVRNNSRKFAEIVAAIFPQTESRHTSSTISVPPPNSHSLSVTSDARAESTSPPPITPKEYNGYKAYWADGAQIISPHDVNIIDYVNRIASVNDIKFTGDPAKIEIIGKDIDKAFLDAIKGLSLSPESIARHHDLKIVYTPIHGTGVTMIPESSKTMGSPT